MGEPLLVLAYDIGTTSAKTCLFAVDGTLSLLASASHSYALTLLPGGGVEQNPNDWWQAMIESTREVLARTGTPPSAIQAVSFCCQMQGLVLVDEQGKALRPAMSYMDQRAVEQWRRGMASGLRIAGLNARRLLSSILLTGGASASVKDPVWKYAWVRENEPEVFARVHKWLDVKEYLLLRCTGRFLMTADSANATFLYDTRRNRGAWSRRLLAQFGVDPRHMPEVIQSTAIAGKITEAAARELGLAAGTPVVGGGGDVTMMALGCGCVAPGDTHVYVGTSGWVTQIIDKRRVDLDHFIGPLVAARAGSFNYIGEQETSGKCMEWVRDHLAMDEIGVYLDARRVDAAPEGRFTSLLGYLDHVVQETEPGSGGAIFTPWLHGNRSPFEDPYARGMFFNIGLDTGKRALIRAVVEGIAYHKRWILECIEQRAYTTSRVRFAGGGAVADGTCQVLADVTGKKVEAMANPQNAGAAGAALGAGIALGSIPSFEAASEMVLVRKTYNPNAATRDIYEKGFSVFKQLHEANKRSFELLNKAGA